MSLPGGLLLTFYGDDFTGSADAAEVLSLNGLPTVLFLDIPSADQLARFAGFRAAGIAGISRSQSPAWMEENLPPVFSFLYSLGTPICQYKVCSTFDSSSETGSIGRALEIGRQAFDSAWVPIVVGAPSLDRYQAFGNLFARVGECVYRLDRHPTMSRHPVTPMDESDLRVHLSRQTREKIGLLDLLALRSQDPDGALDRLLAEEHSAVLFDILDEDSLIETGRLVWGRRPLFAVASSGLQYALVAYWRAAGLLGEKPPTVEVGEVDRMIVASGSASPATAAQIHYAVQNGWTGIRLDACALARGEAAARERALSSVLHALSEGRSVVFYSATGPDDPHLARLDAIGRDELARQTGILLRETLLRSKVRRVLVAGGDTSGHATRQLGAYALTVIRPGAPGSPLCRLWSEGAFDGIEILLKAGQRGAPNLFDDIRAGV